MAHPDKVAKQPEFHLELFRGARRLLSWLGGAASASKTLRCAE
jgi:hypothetical protein